MNKICGRFIQIMKRKKNLENYSACVAIGRQFSFKSDISLEKIYPGSSLKIFTPPSPSSKNGLFSGYIPIEQLDITYSRSSGPGGQHVNCVNTKVQIKFKLESATWIPENARKRILEEHRNRITKDGYFLMKSDVTRSQHMNLADVLEKLRTIIRKLEKPTTFEPTEETLEKIRRRQERAARERLTMKRHRSQIKSDRQISSIE